MYPTGIGWLGEQMFLLAATKTFIVKVLKQSVTILQQLHSPLCCPHTDCDPLKDISELVHYFAEQVLE